MVWIWLAAFAVFLLVEAATMGLTSIWFALGAGAALVTALLGGSVAMQLVFFAVISLAAFAATRPLAKKFIGKKKPTNADRVVGTEGIVLERIDNIAGEGSVIVGGRVWTARTESGESIEKDAPVKILRIEGVKLIVEPYREEQI